MKEFEFEAAVTFVVRAESEIEAENLLREQENKRIHWDRPVDSRVEITFLQIGNVKEYEIE